MKKLYYIMFVILVIIPIITIFFIKFFWDMISQKIFPKKGKGKKNEPPLTGIW